MSDGSTADYHGCGNSGNALATTRKPESFGCSRLDRYAVDINPEVFGDIATHLLDIRQHARTLGDDGDVYIRRRVTALGEQLDDTAQQHARVGSAPALVCVRKMEAYIMHRSRPEQSIRERVQSHIRIAVSPKTRIRRDIHPTYNTLATLDKTMNVKSVSYPDFHINTLSAAAAEEVSETVHIKCKRESQCLVER